MLQSAAWAENDARNAVSPRKSAVLGRVGASSAAIRGVARVTPRYPSLGFMRNTKNAWREQVNGSGPTPLKAAPPRLNGGRLILRYIAPLANRLTRAMRRQCAHGQRYTGRSTPKSRGFGIETGARGSLALVAPTRRLTYRPFMRTKAASASTVRAGSATHTTLTTLRRCAVGAAMTRATCN
jgi:hypothetical protein